jgi:hypothetical protein
VIKKEIPTLSKFKSGVLGSKKNPMKYIFLMNYRDDGDGTR